MPGHRGRAIAAAGILSLGMVLPAGAIEMFTYFGDGSRIGLPSLEVPIQAYPGIPLRSDRIRARMRSQQARRAGAADSAARSAAPDGRMAIPGSGITVRPMTPPGVVPTVPTVPTVPPPVPAGAGRAPDRLEPREAPLPGLERPVFPPQR